MDLRQGKVYSTIEVQRGVWVAEHVHIFSVRGRASSPHATILRQSLADPVFTILPFVLLHQTNFPTPGGLNEDVVDFLKKNHPGS